MQLFIPRNFIPRSFYLLILLGIPLFSLANPVITANNDTSACAGQGGVQLGVTATGGTAPYYYVWSCNMPTCSLDTINDDDPQANPATSTWYYVQVVDFNGCASNIDSIWVEIHPSPLVMGG